MLVAFPGTATGLVLYDAAVLDASRWLAVTTSSLHGWLPATPAQVADPAYACLSKLPVKASYVS